MAQISKIRVTLRGYDAKVVDQTAQSIIETAVRTGAKISGPVPLPVKRELFAVNKSPMVDKRSMEHFEIKTHKRLVDIIEPNAKTVDALQHLQVPAGVDIQIS